MISHAHWDHDAGSAKVKELTGAKYMVMEGDVPVVESGGKADFQYGNDSATLYPPARVDRMLHDGDKVTLGDVVLEAHLTPGHTKGCTTWTLSVRDGDKTYQAVIIGSPNVNAGYRLVDNPKYPTIAQDYERTFRVLKSLRCDLFLGAHGSYFGLEAKYASMKAGASQSVRRRKRLRRVRLTEGGGVPDGVRETASREVAAVRDDPANAPSSCVLIACRRLAL